MDNFSKLGVVLLVGCVIGLALVALLGKIEDSQAQRVRAEAELVQAQTERARVESVAFQERYILFASTLTALLGGITFSHILLLGLCLTVGFLGGWLWKGGAAGRL